MQSATPSPLQRIDQALFDTVAAGARGSRRRRLNHNFHAPADRVQRFLNVLQIGTYVRPHRHRRQPPGAGFECFLVLQGEVGLVLLDGGGRVLGCERISAGGPLFGIELAEGVIHTLVALSADAVLMEIKQGPYEPSADKDFLAGFPLEGSEAAAAQEKAWRALFGDQHEAGGP
ncbi:MULTISPECIES: WbuC family cupin fold metalloprotein [unclassified Cyanobium]|uniref:WbuC family cupin fold metalloprotein n=1 Tax=unclassified Cyanobium TaxID=2627006 RepID=UPI0020CE54AA|nr:MULTISPECIES: WbuC family cupin fold metalloprotein [unclassified Cyanobium]MCP9858383.1 WbuC family cupin fold metalloprotein [Cyanobium sp. Cruz-8H5]MCP9865533.1 WbuC family cupin fold metalloprotein [Cyanobium sp. Cruz-8D1]